MTTAIQAPTRPLGPWANGMIMSPEEFDAVSEWDEDYVYELVHGVLIVSPAPGMGERNPNDQLGYMLRTHWFHHPQGKLLDNTAPEQYIATSAGRRRADRAIWIGLGRAPVSMQDVPTIVVEFTSDSTRDRKRDYETKREEYLEAGVEEYWVIDRFRRMMTVFRQNQKLVVAEHETYRFELLPGFELVPAQLFAVTDGLNPASPEN